MTTSTAPPTATGSSPIQRRTDEQRLGGPPAEIAAGLVALLASEPPHPSSAAPFGQLPASGESRPLTLRRLALAHWRLASAAAALVVASTVEQAGPRLVAFAVDEGLVRRHSFRVVALAGLLYLTVVALTALCQRSLIKVTGRLAAQVMHDARDRVFRHLQRLSHDFYNRERAGVLMTRMTSDVENLQQLVQEGLAQFVLQVLTMLVITVLMLSMSVPLALMTIGLSLPVLLVATVVFKRSSTKAYQRVREGAAEVVTDLSEGLRGARVVRAHNRGDYNVAAHRAITGRYREANAAAAGISSTYATVMQLVGLLSQVLLLGIGGQLVIDGRLDLGELVAFFLYSGRFFQPIQVLVQHYTTYQQSRASLVKLNALLAESPSVLESPSAVELPEVAGTIRFEGVCFGYAGEPTLQELDVTIPAGETVAIVGPTGAGKSTLAKLVTRFYDPVHGRVLLDGHDLREVTLSSLRRQVGLVPQEVFLFAGSLRDNITFARPDAADHEVKAAVRAVGLSDLVARLPEGLDTPVQERGSGLSAGERQLVSLARAFLARPRVLVLDEATANLDMASEARVERALGAVLAGRTAIVIAHRLSTVMGADRVLVLVGGRVAESGPPEELLRAGGPFAQMHATWSTTPTSHEPVRP